MRIREKEFNLPNGKIAIIKSPTEEDAVQLKYHREKTAKETHFMAREPEDGPLNYEKVKEGILVMEKSQTDFLVSAFVDGELIGDLGVMVVRPHIKYHHRAYLGMSIQQKYTCMGLGSFMMRVALEQAKENGFEQVELGVFSDNDRARHMYEKTGFKAFGMYPRAFKLPEGTFCDEIIMVNFLD